MQIVIVFFRTLLINLIISIMTIFVIEQFEILKSRINETRKTRKNATK